MRLTFGMSVATKCIWVDGVASDVSEKMLQSEFGQYGKIQDLIINRSRGHALVYYDQVSVTLINNSGRAPGRVGGFILITLIGSSETDL